MRSHDSLEAPVWSAVFSNTLLIFRYNFEREFDDHLAV